jgi:hypothetical protein
MDGRAEEPASVEKCPVGSILVEHQQTFVGDLVESSSSRPTSRTATVRPAPSWRWSVLSHVRPPARR